MSVFGGVEAGGTKWVCAVGTGPDDLRATETIPTTSPDETIGRAAAFFEREGPVDALGIGSFGPVDLNRSSPTWGSITSTPKPGWAYTGLAREMSRRLSTPVAFDTDVGAAALGEHRWGAAQGLSTFCYVTIGTGIGGGGLANGAPLHGLLHPEFGHLRIPRDPDDTFDGICPYHGDCWEGLASGPAIQARWGKPAEELYDRKEVWVLEARCVALGLVSVISILSPERIVLGGGVLSAPGLRTLVQQEVVELVGGYLDIPALHAAIGDYVVAPALGSRAGVLGAIALAQSVEMA